MGLMNKFLKSKETRCIEKYADDGELCLECTQGDTVRMIKMEKIKEFLHMSNGDYTLKNENGETFFESKDGQKINVFEAKDLHDSISGKTEE